VFSIIEAANARDGRIIGVDGDQAALSDRIITSAMKNLEAAVYDEIAAFYNGRFNGGRQLTYKAANNGVGLPMATSRFRTFNQSQYNTIFGKVSRGEINIPNFTSAETADGLNVSLVTVNLVDG
jgi:basic membrane protein A